ncbi:MAG TPA: CBS domain-containing protein [Candidatus Thermoplasmatota archaeon]|nr:CBS domain-containing protein [Candidatus Thermoplasmatota archaeon]
MKFTDTIKQHMKREIVYTTEDERLADVIFKMANAGTDIAVVKFKDDIVGVITETDIYFALVKEVFSEVSLVIEDAHVIDILRGPHTKEVMASCDPLGWHPCIDTFEDDTMENAIRIMQRSGLHHLLVLDKKNKLVGTLSSHDIIKSFSRREVQIKKK